jgi:hypothetical protein
VAATILRSTSESRRRRPSSAGTSR